MRAGYDFHKASSVEQLKHATVPMLFIHGDQDTFVPYSMLDQNYEACASKVKQKLTIHGATHAKSAQIDPELYWSTVNNFLDEYFRQIVRFTGLSDPLFSEVRGKSREARPDRSFTNDLSGVLLPKKRFVVGGIRFSPHFRKAARERCAHGRFLLTLRNKSA